MSPAIQVNSCNPCCSLYAITSRKNKVIQKKGMKNTKKAMIGNAAGRHFFLKKTNDHAK
jgi:hypothetical protein